MFFKLLHEKSVAVRRFPRGVGRRLAVEKIPSKFPRDPRTSNNVFFFLERRTFYPENGVTPSILSISEIRNDLNKFGWIRLTYRTRKLYQRILTTSFFFFFVLSLRRIPRDSDHSRGLYLLAGVEIAAKRNKTDAIKNSNVGAKNKKKK